MGNRSVKAGLVLLVASTLTAADSAAQTPDGETVARAASALTLRSIGPAVMGGRIADIAVHPTRRSTWYVAAGSGGLWKTTHAGITWTPVFDEQPSYSIGAVTLDRGNLGSWSIGGHDHRTGNPDFPGRPGHRLRMIPSRYRDQAASTFFTGEAQHLVQRAARLERTSML